jgi:hypothetical protein
MRWLLDADPSIRWQVMRDLTDAPAGEVAAERARIATEGTGARLLALQAPDGRWGGAAWNCGWDSTMHVMTLLREMGLDPASDEARRAVGLVRDRVTWRGCGPQEADDNPFFAGEVEPCINGQVAASGAYFGQPPYPERPPDRFAIARRTAVIAGRRHHAPAQFSSSPNVPRNARAKGEARTPSASQAKALRRSLHASRKKESSAAGTLRYSADANGGCMP